MSPQKTIQKRKMGGEQPHGRRFLLCLVVSLLLQGRANAFTINCSGFERHGVDPLTFQAVFDRKAFRPVTNQSFPTHVNISFTLSAILQVDPQLQLMTSFLWIDLTWNNPFISWDPEECVGIKELSVSAEQMWLPDIFILESMNVNLTPSGFTTFVTSEGQIKYSMPMRVTSICNLDIFYFPFDQQNCTLTFCSFLYTVDSMLLGMDKEVWEITNLSRKVIWTRGEWELLSINKATPKLAVGKNLYDQIMFYVAIRRRPTLYIINLLVPSGLLVAIDAFSFYLPAESQNRAPFKITLLLGYNVFLLMMNDLLPATGTPLISVYFALCLSLMVVSLLETVFITYLLHLATTQPPPMPWWLHSLMLRYNRKPCPSTAPQDNSKGLGHSNTHLPGLKEPVELVAKGPGLVVPEVHGCPKQPRVRQEHETPQQQQLVELWVQFSHLMDTLLFRLYLLFMACSIITVIILWST